MVLDFTFYKEGLPGCAACSSQACRGFCRCLYLWLVHLNPVGYVRHLVKRPHAGKRLLSLPGGPAFATLAQLLGPELRTVWLGRGAKCHDTDEDHPFSVELCPHSRCSDCWQCLYMLQVQLTISQGEVPVVATTNLYHGIEEHGGGSSEVAGETFQNGVPEGWGIGLFGEDFGELAGKTREAKEHADTHMPLGVGCRWERRYLDSLPEKVYVVARPPQNDELESNDLAWLCFAADMAMLLTLVLPDHLMDLMQWIERWQFDEGGGALIVKDGGLDIEYGLLASAVVILLAGICLRLLHGRRCLRVLALPVGFSLVMLTRFGVGILLGSLLVICAFVQCLAELSFSMVVLLAPLAIVLRMKRLGCSPAVAGRGTSLLLICCNFCFFCKAKENSAVKGSRPHVSSDCFIWCSMALQGSLGLGEIGAQLSRFGLRNTLLQFANVLCPCCVGPPGQMTPLKQEPRYLRRGCSCAERVAPAGQEQSPLLA